MLTVHEGWGRRGRRAFLQIGGLALGGLSLSHLLATQSYANTSLRPVKDRSVIFLFLHGGPSQFETFDPKMAAPAGVRSVTGETSTRLPGVTFGGTFSRLAALSEKISIVRSFTTGNGNHDIKPIMCPETLGANLGTLYSRVAGVNHPTTGLPTNVVLYPRAVDAETRPTTLAFGNFAATGALGAGYAPFVPGAGGEFQKNLELTLPMARLDDRRRLLGQLDQIKRTMDANGSLEGTDRFRAQAFETIIGGAAEAFDLSKEDPRVVARYDTSTRVLPNQISRRWNNYHNYVDNAKSLGKLLLLARRLCEAGCGFVTITTNFVWDMHADANNAGVEEGMEYMGRPLDHALSAYLEDTESRGLSERILLVVAGEMGRTPKINNLGGRDHWGGLAPLLLSGGGLAMGQVIGQSTADGGAPQSEPHTIKHLMSTIMHTLLDVGEVRTIRGVPPEVLTAVTSGAPIAGLH